SRTSCASSVSVGPSKSPTRSKARSAGSLTSSMKFNSGSRQAPRLAILVVQQLIGCVTVGEPLGLRVPIQPRSGCKRDVGQMRKGGRSMALFDVRVWFLPALHAVEEASGRLLIEIAVARLDGLLLPFRRRVLKRAPALRHDLVAIA